MYVAPTRSARRSRIAAVGTYLPARVVASTEIEAGMRARGLAVPPGFLERATGIARRHVAASGENASDLAVAAARAALRAGGREPADVDVLVFAAASHDVTEPATANIVQTKLGARRAVVFDVKNACNSLLSALDVADAYVQLGRAETVLVTTGEVPSLVVNRTFATRAELSERFSHATMGDAGGALLLVASDDPARGIQATAGRSRGEAWALGTVLSFGTMHPHDTSPARALLHTDACRLEASARAELPAVIAAVLDAAGWSAASVDVIAGHQHTRRIAVDIARAAGLDPARLALPLREAGNAAAANVPLALADAERGGRLVPGARVLLCGGSAGFSAIASAVVW
jgi:3-oxoacyl-[acyl-carrier-protein] synthase-3